MSLLGWTVTLYDVVAGWNQVPLHLMRENRRRGFWVRNHSDESDARFALTVALSSFIAGVNK